MGAEGARRSKGTEGARRKNLSTLHPNTTLNPNPDPDAQPNPQSAQTVNRQKSISYSCLMISGTVPRTGNEDPCSWNNGC